MSEINTYIKTMIANCYGRYNSFRIRRIGNLNIDELYQYIVNSRSQVFPVISI